MHYVIINFRDKFPPPHIFLLLLFPRMIRKPYVMQNCTYTQKKWKDVHLHHPLTNVVKCKNKAHSTDKYIIKHRILNIQTWGFFIWSILKALWIQIRKQEKIMLLHKTGHFNRLAFLSLFEPWPRLGQYLCLKTPGIRNKDRCKITNMNWCNMCDVIMM